MIKGKLKKEDMIILTIIGLITLIGVISNFSANIQTGVIPMINDIGNTFKVFIVYIGAKIIIPERTEKKRIIVTLAKVIKLFVYIMFIFLILHELHIVSMGNDVRFGLHSFKFINNGAGQLSMMFYFILTILTLDLKYCKRKISISIILALCIWAFTLRSRAFMYCVVYVFLYWLIIKKKQQVKLSLKTILPVVGILLLFAQDQFETYFLNSATARANFVKYGIQTMINYFPLGSGFATFGTDAAATYYSPLYRLYGFSHVYGLSEDKMSFAHDTYWPAIAAQFGVFGLALIILLIWKVCKELLQKTNGDYISRFAALFVIITQVSSSVATATFFNFVTVSLFFIVPLMYSKPEEKRDYV